MAAMAAVSVSAIGGTTNTVTRKFLTSSKDLRVTGLKGGQSFVAVRPLGIKNNGPQKSFRVQAAALSDLTNDPILKEALKEPVAFLGGLFAGLLRLDLNEDPLREWIAKTAEAAGIPEEEPEYTSSGGGPEEIQID